MQKAGQLILILALLLSIATMSQATTLNKKQFEFTLMVGRLIVATYGMGFTLTFGHTWRDSEEQKRYYEMGLSETLNSKHQQRLAIDLNLFKNGKYIKDGEAYRPLGELWQQFGGKWGGDFGDYDHFEYKD